MKRAIYIIAMLLICALPAQTLAQGQGKGNAGGNKAPHAQGGQKQGQGAKAAQQKGSRAQAKQQPQQASGKKAERGRSGNVNAGKSARAVERKALGPDVDRTGVRTVNRMAGYSARERAASAAVSRAFARGTPRNAFVITPIGDRVRITNRTGGVLLDMDDKRARSLGYWDVMPIRNGVRSNAPSFCRSGAGHPTWGRQWCIDKGFGLGTYRDLNWGRATTIGDIILGRRYDTGSLAGNVLLAAIGAVAYDRLALHAISLGYTEPLAGTWIAEPSGPRVLQLYSGGYPVAEIVDADRDYRADVMVFALRF